MPTFNGNEYESGQQFARDYPAYATAWKLVEQGLDTPHKVECELYRIKQERLQSKPSRDDEALREKQRRAAHERVVKRSPGPARPRGSKNK